MAEIKLSVTVKRASFITAQGQFVYLFMFNSRELQYYLTPPQTLYDNRLLFKSLFFPNTPSEGWTVYLHPVPSKCSSQKYLDVLYVVLIFFCLLKIVLQVLASFDIKITIMCKTLTMKRLIRIQAGCPIWMLSILHNFPFHFSPPNKQKTNKHTKPRNPCQIRNLWFRAPPVSGPQQGRARSGLAGVTDLCSSSVLKQ